VPPGFDALALQKYFVILFSLPEGTVTIAVLTPDVSNAVEPKVESVEI